ncbi:MAG: type II secretion system ATPase GspE [Thermodesulfobacteriota bacterium]
MKAIPIGELFLNDGLIDEKILATALEEQARTGEKLGVRLVKLGCVSEQDMLRVLSNQLEIPCITTDNYSKTPPALDIVPSLKFMRFYKAVPIRVRNGILTIASADPLNHLPAEAFAFATGLEVDVVVGSESDILNAIESYYGDGPVTMEKIIEDIDEKDSANDLDIDDVEQLKDMALEAPVINLVNMLIRNAIERKASDIHIEPYENTIHIRYRVDGIMYDVESMPKRLHPAISSRIKIMAKLNIAERRLPQDGRIKLKLSGKGIDIRVSIIPTLHGESLVMRLLDPDGVMTLESLGFSKARRDAFSDMINQPHGMVLVTGPTGSGKSTTLYAALSKVDITSKKVITIEDPVEYKLEGLNQIQVKPKIGLTFGNGLRSIVRQDPDVVLVGEIRDTETADIAIHSALTGHMILSTLHTNDAPGAITRLIDMGVEGYLISSSLLGVLAQRLVRVICESCKVEVTPEPEMRRRIADEYRRVKDLNDKDIVTYRGTGCTECSNSGYRGRTGLFELMLVNDEIRHLIVEKSSSDVIRQKAIENGMVTLREDGWKKVLSGKTTVEEVGRVTLT